MHNISNLWQKSDFGQCVIYIHKTVNNQHLYEVDVNYLSLFYEIKCLASCFRKTINICTIISSLFLSYPSLRVSFTSFYYSCSLSLPPHFPPSVPFARCDIVLIEQKHVERSGISQGITAHTTPQKHNHPPLNHPKPLPPILSVLSALLPLLLDSGRVLLWSSRVCWE